MEYTKGEWKQQVASNDNRIVMCGIYNIAQVNGRAHKEETEANARLISAAPNLYEALKELAYIMEGVIEAPDAAQLDSFTLQPARQALAKV